MPVWHIIDSGEPSDVDTTASDELLLTMAEKPQSEPVIDPHPAITPPSLCAFLTELIRQHPVINSEAATTEQEALPTPTLNTLIIVPPRKCLHEDFKMPLVDSITLRQLRNLPGRQSTTPSHPSQRPAPGKGYNSVPARLSLGTTQNTNDSSDDNQPLATNREQQN